MRSRFDPRLQWTVLILGLSMGLAACSKHASSKGQVVATVNNHEITFSQLKQAMYSQGAGDVGTDNPQATKQALQSLVNEELLVQKAIAGKLDRDPDVIRAIDAARRQILVRAYAERMVFPTGDIPVSDEQQYYRDHLLLFQKRKFYQFVAYGLDSTVSPALRSDLEQTHSPEQVHDLLIRHQMKFSAQKVSRAAEALPAELLPQFAKAAVGDVLIGTQTDGTALVMCMTGTIDSPLDFEQASLRIQEYLVASRNRAALENYVRQAEATAKVSYATNLADLQPAPKPPEQKDTQLANAVKGL
jgi:peptidyl-prolyl cis-trans isomerase C